MNNKVVYAWYHDNIPFYIGMGTIKRSKQKTNRNNHCLNKRLKAERENCFEIKILHSNLSKEQACELERKYISIYGRVDNGTGILTNQTEGGECTNFWLGKKMSEQHKIKISISQKGKKRTKEQRERISQVHKGKRISEKTKRKMSKSISKTVHTPEGVFSSCTEAAQYYKMSQGAMSKILRDSSKQDFYYM